MSIMQDYEEIKNNLGLEEWEKLNYYCETKNILLSNVLYNLEEWKKYKEGI